MWMIAHRLRAAGRLFGRPGPRVDAPVVPAPHGCSLLETRLRERWAQATAVDAETARHAAGRRLVRVDGWSTEAWLTRRAASHRDDARVITRDAIGAVDPGLSAANLLALRTALVVQGVRDG